MPGNGLPFPVRVRCKVNLVMRGSGFFQLFYQLFFSLNNGILRLKVVFDINIQLGSRKVPYMTHRGHYVIILTQDRLNGLGLGR